MKRLKLFISIIVFWVIIGMGISFDVSGNRHIIQLRNDVYAASVYSRTFDYNTDRTLSVNTHSGYDGSYNLSTYSEAYFSGAFTINSVTKSGTNLVVNYSLNNIYLCYSSGGLYANTQLGGINTDNYISINGVNLGGFSVSSNNNSYKNFIYDNTTGTNITVPDNESNRLKITFYIYGHLTEWGGGNWYSYSNVTRSETFYINLNTPPVVSTITPSQNGTFSDYINPSINDVSDADNNTLTCKYFIDTETNPRETKTVTNTTSPQPVTFTQLNVSTLSEGQHTIKFDVNDGTISTVQTVNFTVERKPVIGTVTVTSTNNQITVSGSATDSKAGLDPLPYNISIGTNTSDWIASSMITANSTVVNSAYDTSGNGGRKLVRLSNGWLVAVVNNSGTFYWYKSTDNGLSWTQLCYYGAGGTINGFAQCSFGTTVWMLFDNSLNTHQVCKFDATTVTNGQVHTSGGSVVNIDSSQTSYGSGVSIECDSSGNLYAAWSSKNSTYPNSFNIRHAKSTNGGTTWTKADGTAGVDQVTNSNGTYWNYTEPVVQCISNGKPIIFMCFDNTTGGHAYQIYCRKFTAAWDTSDTIIYNGGLYDQSNPCVVVAPNGRIWVAWQGRDSTDNNVLNIKASYSDDNGANWSSMQRVTTGNTYNCEMPSIAVDINYVPYIIHTKYVSKYNIRQAKYNGSTWDLSDITNQSSADIKYPSTCSNYTNFTDPLYIYQDIQAGAVKFRGTVPIDTAYTASGLTPGKLYPVSFKAKDNALMIGEYTANAYTKADVPVLSSGTKTTTTIELITGDLNAPEAQYQIACGTKYVSQTGALADTPQWITLTNKKVTVTGLLANREYTFVVKARNGDNIETTTNQLVVTTLPNPPAIPVNIKASVLSGTSIKITWDAVEGATGYKVMANGIVIEENIPLPSYTHRNLTPSTSYTYKVCSVNAGGPCDWSSGLTKTTLVGIPQSIVLDHSGGTYLDLSWQTVNGASGYDVEVDGVVNGTTKTASYKITGLVLKTQHTLRVRAKNLLGSGEWSPVQTFATTNGVPTDKPVVSLSLCTNTTAVLHWADVADAEYYEIIDVTGVATNPPAGKDSLNNGPYTTCEKRGLAPMSTHTYWVRAVNSVDHGPWSDPMSVTTLLLDTPQNISAKESDTSILLTWDPVLNATSYDITYSGGTINSLTNAYTLTGLTPETEYNITITAKNASGASAPSNTASVHTLPLKPAVPTNVNASVTDTVITVSWDAVPSIDGYDVELDGVVLENDSTLLYIHDGLEPYTVHTYRVRARNSAVEGEWSPVQSIRTLPGKPKAPGGISVKSTQTGATLSWTAEPGAISYDLEISDGVNQPVYVRNICTTTYTHRRIAPYSQYKYRLLTRNSEGVSDWSGTIINNAVKKTCKKNETSSLNLGVTDITDFTPYTMVVTYNPGVLEVADLCTLTGAAELAPGKIDGTNVTILEASPGRIVFVVDKVVTPGEAWTGIINSIRFKAKVTGGTTVTYTVLSKV